MSREAPGRREELLAGLHVAGRQLSAATIMFHHTVADRLGLNATDHKILDQLALGGPQTAGELAALTGLTTGAITSAIDRLERAGYARRADDPHDRRRVIVRPVAARVRRIGRLFVHLAAASAELCARYRDDELATILDFQTRAREMMHDATVKLRGQGEAARKGRRRGEKKHG
jgi:DNA-binding MarR family transcriptional regulator